MSDENETKVSETTASIRDHIERERRVAAAVLKSGGREAYSQIMRAASDVEQFTIPIAEERDALAQEVERLLGRLTEAHEGRIRWQTAASEREAEARDARRERDRLVRANLTQRQALYTALAWLQHLAPTAPANGPADVDGTLAEVTDAVSSVLGGEV